MEILKRFGDKDDIGQIEVIIYNWLMKRCVYGKIVILRSHIDKSYDKSYIDSD